MYTQDEFKVIYRLWRQYLKRSAKYKVFCTYADKKNAYSAFAEPAFKDASAGEKRSIRRSYQFFGDVFKNDADDEKMFDKWWKTSRHGEQWSKSESGKKGLDQAALPIVEIKDRRSFRTLSSDIAYMMVAIPLISSRTMEDIAPELKKLRDNYKKTEEVKKADAEYRKIRMPSGKFNKEDLEFYLKVYDMRQAKLKKKEIIKKLHPWRDPTGANDLRTYSEYYAIAQRIIKNVERGEFPGKLSKELKGGVMNNG